MDFDREFKKTRNLVYAGIAVVGLGSLIFIGWVIVKVLGHFGVV